MQLPLYRFMEIEADDVGLVLAAKACLDVRKAPEFWSKMSLNRDDALQNEVKTFNIFGYLQFHKVFLINTLEHQTVYDFHKRRVEFFLRTWNFFPLTQLIKPEKKILKTR